MKHKIKLTTTQLILLSFLIAIVAGSLLLMLPISSATGLSVAYVDALFTATTAVCVTGLVTLPTVSSWSFFGQFILLILIQIGGLGIITIMSGLMISLHKKMGMKERILIQDAFNLNTMSGMIRFIKKVLFGTFIVEAIGAVLYMLVFVPEFGLRGVWISVFNSISAFCNAGIDVLSENSLMDYGTHPLVLSVTNSLIILGGIGYVVWWDVLRVLKEFKTKKMRCLSGLTLHSKIALSMTVFLLVSGTVLFFIFEYSNPLTMMNYSLFDKVQASFFQAVTTRTAGFATFPQENLTNASAFVSLLLMFIGGSPVGTAGGVKTVTIAVLIYAAFATIKNEEEVVLFDRTIAKKTISKSVAVVFVSFMIMCISTILLSSVTDAPMLDILYETVSATATVGLTRNLTSTLNLWGKLIVIVTMYFGRVGPISMIIAFNTSKDKKNIIKNPTEEISVG